MNNYDVIIIGAGVIGSFVARYLSQYNGKFLVLEKNNDVGDETTNANSAIVHSGYDPLPNTKKAYFNVLGNKMMGDVCKELDVHFIRNGSLTIGFNEEDHETLKALLKRAEENGVRARIIESEELHKLEPKLNKECLYALYCEDSGIVCPFELCVSAMENAMDNGVELALNKKVIGISKEDGLYKIVTEDNSIYYSKAVVNATGVYGDDVLSLIEKTDVHINPRKGEYILLDHFDSSWLKRTLFMCPTKVGKGVLVSPTTSSNYIIGPSNDLSTKEDVSTDSLTMQKLKETAKKLIGDIPYEYTIRTFAGTRANPDNDDFIIEESKINENFYNLIGIMSPGLASSPAIGEYAAKMIGEKLNLSKNSNFNPIVRPKLSLSKLGLTKYNELIKEHKEYGKVVCRCEKVTEGEIIDVIHRNCGATTVKGVKKRIRSGFGKCQGTFCQEEVIRILARELNLPLEDIKYSNKDSNILKTPSKGGN